MLAPTPVRLTRAVLATVILVSTIAPLATDMYVPAFPQVGSDLAGTATQVQLTLTTFFVGMALGQLIGGPVSDARGRRGPLLLALIVLTVASIACAYSPSITMMMIARFVQGLSGGWAMVTARAVIMDLTQGPQLVRSLNLVAGVGGIAPIVGPLLGAVILQLFNWRVSFWVVALFGARDDPRRRGRNTGIAPGGSATSGWAFPAQQRCPCKSSDTEPSSDTSSSWPSPWV